MARDSTCSLIDTAQGRTVSKDVSGMEELAPWQEMHLRAKILEISRLYVNLVVMMSCARTGIRSAGKVAQITNVHPTTFTSLEGL